MIDNISTLNRIINSLRGIQNSFQNRIAMQSDIVELCGIIVSQEKRIQELEEFNKKYLNYEDGKFKYKRYENER